MRRKVVTVKDQKNPVKKGENFNGCLTSNDDVDKNLLKNTAENKTSGESSGVGSTSKRDKKKDVVKNAESVVNGSVENSQKAVLASKHGGKKGNKNLESKQNKESNKDVSELPSDGELKENGIESSIEKQNLKDVKIIAENPETSEKRDVNEVLMKRGKKQTENKKANKDSAGDASEGMKSVEKQIREKESSVIKDLTVNEEDDFVNEKKDVLGKRGKKKQTAAVTKNNNAIESKNVPKKNLRKNTKNNETKGFADNEIPPVSLSNEVQSSKGNKKRKKNGSELNNEPDIKHSKSERESSDETQGATVGVTKELRVVLDRCEEVENVNENKNLPHDTLISLKNGKGKANTKRKRVGDDEGKGDKKAKSAKEPKQPDTSKGSSKKETISDVTSVNFSNDSKSSSGKSWNLKISSWNVNGIRAWLQKNGLSFLHHEKPDVLCVQETKCSDDKLPEEVKNVEDYHAYWLSGDKDGYSGVGLLSKEKPQNVEYGIGVSEHDNEGRVITAEYEKFYLVAVYVPNAGRGLVRLNYRMEWDKDFRAYLKKLDEKKPVILCGDLNVAHEEIDLANPKTNKKNAGFTKEEREGFSTLLSEGFIDTFRHLYPDVKGAYTFWTYMMNARAKNVGWRLDYFVISKRFDESLCDNVIRKDVLGSDHCPVTLFLSV